MRSFTASLSMMVAYGRQVKPEKDPLVEAVEESVALLNIILSHSGVVVNAVPARKLFSLIKAPSRSDTYQLNTSPSGFLGQPFTKLLEDVAKFLQRYGFNLSTRYNNKWLDFSR